MTNGTIFCTQHRDNTHHRQIDTEKMKQIYYPADIWLCDIVARVFNKMYKPLSGCHASKAKHMLLIIILLQKK